MKRKTSLHLLYKIFPLNYFSTLNVVGEVRMREEEKHLGKDMGCLCWVI